MAVAGGETLAQVVSFPSRLDAALSSADVWGPFLLAAVVLLVLAAQVGTRRGRATWADVLEPRATQRCAAGLWRPPTPAALRER